MTVLLGKSEARAALGTPHKDESSQARTATRPLLALRRSTTAKILFIVGSAVMNRRSAGNGMCVK